MFTVYCTIVQHFLSFLHLYLHQSFMIMYKLSTFLCKLCTFCIQFLHFEYICALSVYSFNTLCIFCALSVYSFYSLCKFCAFSVYSLCILCVQFVHFSVQFVHFCEWFVHFKCSICQYFVNIIVYILL